MVYGQGLRLDKWLWFARLTKSRSAAQQLCESRYLRLDGRVIDRASALVRAGSVVSFPRNDDVVVVRVEGLADARRPYAEACHLYTDLGRSPAPVEHVMPPQPIPPPAMPPHAIPPSAMPPQRDAPLTRAAATV